MKKFLVALLLTFLCQTTFAEYVTILPVTNRQIENVVSELVSLSELYGKTTTIRYWVNDPATPFVAALSNTNIIPTNSLTTTEDLLVENKFDGLYVGAIAQTDSQRTTSQVSPNVVKTVSFADSLQNYQTKVRSNVALASLIEEQTNSMLDANDNASELVALNSEDVDFGVESGLMAGDKTTIMDTLLSGMTRSTDYELPMSTENILISGIGGAILNGYSVIGNGAGGSASGGGSYAGGGSNVPEPTTWAMLLIGSFALVWFRKYRTTK